MSCWCGSREREFNSASKLKQNISLMRITARESIFLSSRSVNLLLLENLLKYKNYFFGSFCILNTKDCEIHVRSKATLALHFRSCGDNF